MLLMIWGVTVIHADMFKNNKPITWTFHIFWSLPFAALVYFAYRFSNDLWLVSALALERLAWYNIILNKIRNKPIFYIGAQTKNEAWTDKLIEIWINNFAGVFWISVILWITVNILRFIKFI